MASLYRIFKNYAAFRGLDSRSSDLSRRLEYASDILNVEYGKSGAMMKRKGQQYRMEQSGGGGLGIWIDRDTTNGTLTEKLVAIDDNLHVRSAQTLTVSYSGSGSSAWIELYFSADDSKYYLDIYEDAALVLQIDLGIGTEVSSPVLISDVVTQISALADFSASASGTDTNPATYLQLTDFLDLISGSNTLQYYQWEQANSPASAPLSDYWAKRNDSSFEIASLVNLTGVLFVSTGHSELHKYDGKNFYRAGMPQGEQLSAAVGPGGSITNADTRYILTYIQKDAKGNIIEGIESDASSTIALSSESADLTIDNIQASSGFNTNCAIVAGAQAGVTTITVDDGSAGSHTLKVGDTAYFYDTSTSEYVEREVTAITATTIDIAGAAVDVDDNSVISNNLKIAIYRNQSSGDTYALVAEIPNNSFSATQSYNDDIADLDLGAEYIIPIKSHGLPPKGKYATAWRNQLMIAGKLDELDTFFYSDLQPEYFPGESNSQNVDTEFGDIITGVAVNNNTFFVFKNKTIHTVTGDLINDNFRVDQVNSGGIGCEAHASIQEVQGSIFFLSKKGVFSVSTNELFPQEISMNIEPEFTTTYNYKQASAINWIASDKYILNLPVILTNDEGIYQTDNSRAFVFDYHHGSWVLWDNFDALGGLAIIDDNLWMTGKQPFLTINDINPRTAMRMNYGNVQDYVDHGTAITFRYKSHWEAVSEPSVFKKFLRCKVFSLDAEADNEENVAFKLDVTGENDFIPLDVFSLTLNFGGVGENAGGGWGNEEWGLFPWGSSKLFEIKNKLKSNKARSLRLIFENSTALEPVYISGFELEIATPYRVSMKE